MRRLILPALVAFTALSSPGAWAAGALDYGFTAIEGGPLPLSGYKGKAVLVVNTASLCGYTPQYEGLQALWQAYRDKGLVVLGVPSNDFGGQEPGSESQIKEFCAVNFAIDFPMTAKVAVTGPQAHPFYKWAGAEKGPPKWNFHKYLVAPDGTLVAAFPSTVAPQSAVLKDAIEKVLPR
ncbi:glutathione peroxidase [Aerophototrophica crusticola]|uniref:Glutathione peroxidase n=1 Tax=Aerophototrophica crusticola TaxID=1709002 RepID=A0A858R576_9PROT|nr:glutathione peroxidase [Rhodospirillaceae bacterium B3]